MSKYKLESGDSIELKSLNGQQRQDLEVEMARSLNDNGALIKARDMAACFGIGTTLDGLLEYTGTDLWGIYTAVIEEAFSLKDPTEQGS